MTILRLLFTVSVWASLILTSCSPVRPAATDVPPNPASLPQPTSTPTGISLNSEPASSEIPALLFQYNQGELAVISAETGQPLESFAPITFHDFYSYTFAPDGHTLAFVANPKLYLIDMPSWKIREYDLSLHGWVSSMVYSVDGSRLALASGEPESKLWIVDPKSGQITANQKADFSIRKIQFTSDGNSLMAYGPHIASTGVAAGAGVSVGPPRAALYSSSNLELLWSTELEGVQDGTFPKKPGDPVTDSIYLPGSAWHYEPGTAFSPKSNLLYLVHADEDKLTTIDFASRKVHTLDIQAKTSWLDRLMKLTAGVAYAKGMDGTVKQAWISTDGRLLFVGGIAEKVTMPTDSSSLEITDTPIGLKVINVGDGTLLGNIDEEITPTGLSLDGRYLFLTNEKNNDRNIGLKTDIYDTTSLSILKQIDNVSLMPTRPSDGEPILVSTEFSGTNGDNVCNLTTVDPNTWAIIHQWKGDCVIWLNVP